MVLDETAQRDEQPSPSVFEGSVEDSGPAGVDQAFEAAGVLHRAQSAHHRQGDGPPIRLDPHDSGAETHPGVVFLAGPELREPDLRALALAGF